MNTTTLAPTATSRALASQLKEKNHYSSIMGTLSFGEIEIDYEKDRDMITFTRVALSWRETKRFSKYQDHREYLQAHADLVLAGALALKVNVFQVGQTLCVIDDAPKAAISEFDPTPEPMDVLVRGLATLAGKWLAAR